MNYLFRSLPLVLLILTGLSCSGVSWHTRTLSADRVPWGTTRARQIVEVTPVGQGQASFKAILTAWDYDRGAWRMALGPWPAVIGRTGFAPAGEKQEGDGHTPSGSYAIGTAFGELKALPTGLAYRRVREDDIWVDDPSSTDYNRWVRLPTGAVSYEKMLQPDGLYELAAVIEYNTAPVVAGKGSAIFLHIWRDRGRKATAGCVALERRRLRRLLGWLQANKEPAIVLGMR